MPLVKAGMKHRALVRPFGIRLWAWPIIVTAFCVGWLSALIPQALAAMMAITVLLTAPLYVLEERRWDSSTGASLQSGQRCRS